MDRPWLRRSVVGASIALVLLAVAYKVFVRAPRQKSGELAVAAPKVVSGPSAPEPKTLDDILSEVRAENEALKKLLAEKQDPAKRMTPAEAKAATIEASYPSTPTAIAFKPTPALRDALNQAETLSRPSIIGAVEKFRTKYGENFKQAGMNEPLDRFADALAKGKSIEDALDEIFSVFGMKGKQAIDAVFDEKLKEYQGKITKYEGVIGKTYKLEEYALRIEMLLTLKVEMDKSVKPK